MGGLRSNFSRPARRRCTAPALAALLALAGGLGACGANAPEARRTDFEVAADVAPGSAGERHWQQFVTNVRTWSPKFDVRLTTARVDVRSLGDGPVQVARVEPASLLGTLPELGVLEMPLLFESESEADYVLDRHLLQEVRRRLDARGYTLLAWAEGPARVLYLAGDSPDESPRPVTLEAHAAGAGTPPGTSAVLMDAGTAPALVLARSAWYDALPPRDEDALRMAYPTAEARADARRVTADAIAALAGKPTHALRVAGDAERRAWRAARAERLRSACAALGAEAVTLCELVERGRAEYAAQQR